MQRLLPPLHDGHAPFILHMAFQDALDAFEDWAHIDPEPAVELDQVSVPISSVFGRMRTCTDILPQRTLDDVRAVIGASHRAMLPEDSVSYAAAAMVLRALCVERLKAQ